MLDPRAIAAARIPECPAEPLDAPPVPATFVLAVQFLILIASIAAIVMPDPFDAEVL